MSTPPRNHPEEKPSASGVSDLGPKSDLDRGLAALPDIAPPPALVAAVQRRARIAFAQTPSIPLDRGGELPPFEAPAKPGTLAAVWTRTLLPLLLLFFAAMYTVTSLISLTHVYAGH